MDERVFFVIFFTIFLAVYGALNYYVLYKLYKLFSLERTITFYIILIIATISYLLANILASSINSIITKILYYIASTWMGMAFIAFCLLLLSDLINLVLPLQPLTTGMAVLCIVVVVSAYSLYNANNIRITNINLTSAKLDKPLHIVQISDVHLGPVNGKHFLSRIISMTNSLDPEIVLMTGDLIDGKFYYDPGEFKMLNNISGQLYFTTGNHETYAGVGIIGGLLNDTKVKILRNQADEIRPYNTEIIGIDDSDDYLQVKKQLETLKINDSRYLILMYHRPPGFKDAAAKGIDLMLAGHTHGGQIWPFSILTALANRPIKGIHRLNQTYLYVSEGVGTWGPPMRLGTKAEIVNIVVNPVS